MLIDSLNHHCIDRPTSNAIISRKSTYAFRRLAEDVQKLSCGLLAQGIRAGDRVALHMTNIPELLVSYYACFSIGAIAAPLNIRLKTPELRSLLSRLRPAIYLGEAQLYTQVAAVESEILPEGARFVLDAGDDAGARNWAWLLEEAKSHIDCSQKCSDPDAIAVLLTTSGTTGQPKFVTHTHATLSAFSRIIGRLGLDRAEIPLVAMPLVHVAALVSSIYCIEIGVPMTLLERFDADAVLDAIELDGCSWMIGTPVMFAEMIARQRASSRDLSTLRLCRSVGDVCPIAVQRAFPEVFGIPLCSFWGSTETGAFAHGLQLGPVSRIPPEMEVRLVDDHGAPVADGAVGEMLVRGPSVTPGYWIGPNCIEDPKSDDWFPTGDLVRRGVGDELWFVSRKRDLIVRGGSNISPAEVEQVLLSHPAVSDAAVFGIPDTIQGQQVAALVHLAGEMGENTLDDIMTYARASLADYKIPERLEVVREIPRNALGKVDRKMLQKFISGSQ